MSNHHRRPHSHPDLDLFLVPSAPATTRWHHRTTAAPARFSSGFPVRTDWVSFNFYNPRSLDWNPRPVRDALPPFFSPAPVPVAVPVLVVAPAVAPAWPAPSSKNWRPLSRTGLEWGQGYINDWGKYDWVPTERMEKWLGDVRDAVVEGDEEMDAEDPRHNLNNFYINDHEQAGQNSQQQDGPGDYDRDADGWDEDTVDRPDEGILDYARPDEFDGPLFETDIQRPNREDFFACQIQELVQCGERSTAVSAAFALHLFVCLFEKGVNCRVLNPLMGGLSVKSWGATKRYIPCARLGRIGDAVIHPTNGDEQGELGHQPPLGEDISVHLRVRL